MTEEMITLTLANIGEEHLCCGLADKKHQAGAEAKKEWLREQIPLGHVFRKLNARAKVFIEYAPVEVAWVPVMGENYLYIYCHWVSGSYKGKGYGKQLLADCIADAQSQGKAGVCVMSAKKKKPFLSDKSFFIKHGFHVADRMGDEYELLALSLKEGKEPQFAESAKKQSIANSALTIYYGKQCPYILDCIAQVTKYCHENQVEVETIPVDTLKKAKAMPSIFNNWAVFYQRQFLTVHLLNEGFLKKLLVNME